MFRCAVTLSLVPEAKAGPFVFSEDLETGCQRAAELGFDAIELFPRAAEEIDARSLRQLLDQHGLKLAAVGTGAGWVVQGLSLTDAAPEKRARARAFIGAIIDFAGSFGAPAIIGSMQGRAQGAVTRDQALAWLQESFEQLGPRAHACGTPLLFEPLNRYETNLINTLSDAISLLKPLRTRNVKLLGDCFHMNVEEASIPEALKLAGPQVHHIHLADSNRRAAGFGHTDFGTIAQALKAVAFDGYLSAEVLPLPDPETAAQQTLETVQKYFGKKNAG